MNAPELWQLGQFSVLIIPSILVVVGMGFVGARRKEGWEQRRLLFLLAATALSLGLLVLLILTNPYGWEISSSLSAMGMLPVTVALLATLLDQAEALKRLWSERRALLLGLGLVILGLMGALGWLERYTFYLVLASSLVMGLALFLARRAGMLWLTVLSLVVAAGLTWLGGGWFWTAEMLAPAWQVTLRGILLAACLLLAIFLPAALLYTSLKGEGVVERKMLAWSLLLSVLLVGCTAYQVYWDGIWSAAHARAFEDHLPFSQLLVSLAGGVLLALLLHGRRRWVGVAYTLGVVALCVAALSVGWRVSAFDITAQRAEKVDVAIRAYRQEKGTYPENLGALTPGYLLYLPAPVVVRLGGWCYSGGDGGYRLGYVSGDFTYFSADFRSEVYSQDGTPPEGEGWQCEQMIQRLSQGDLGY